MPNPDLCPECQLPRPRHRPKCPWPTKYPSPFGVPEPIEAPLGRCLYCGYAVPTHGPRCLHGTAVDSDPTQGAFQEPTEADHVDLDAAIALYDRIGAGKPLASADDRMDFVVRVSPETTAARVLAEIEARGDRHSRWGAREQ